MEVAGPVLGGARDLPFAFGIEPAAGYRLDEYFLAGEARGYDLEPGTEYTADGRWRARPNRTAPFRTRLLVLRPTDRGAFDGTVVVNWQNVTAGLELSLVPSGLQAAGSVWVGVTAQVVGIEGFPGMPGFALKAWDAERYGSLTHPGDDFSFDIFTQAARLVGRERADLSGDAPDLLPGYDVRRILAMGSSQSALRLRGYVNAIEALEPRFDGFLLSLDIGSAPLLDTTGMQLAPLQIPQAKARVRDDLAVPVFVVNSETEVPRLFPVRQPDTDRFRLWEIAGAAHIGGARLPADAMAHELERYGLPAEVIPQGREPDTNVLSHAPVQRAAFGHMTRWITDGTPPPSFPLIESHSEDPDAIRRDADGNALGGVRLPDLVEPLAAHAGVRAGETDMLKRITGTSRPLAADTLRTRYVNLADYLDRYAAAVDQGIAEGSLAIEDRDELLALASDAAGAVITW